MPITVNNSLDNRSNRPDNHKYLKQLQDGSYRPYLTVLEANQERPEAYRALGLTYRIGSTISNSVEYWYQYDTTDTGLVLKTGANFYYDGDDFEGDVKGNSPLKLKVRTGISGVWENPKLTLNSKGVVVAVEEGTGGGTITDFVTDTDVEIYDVTKGVIHYSPVSGKKWRMIADESGAFVPVDVYATDPITFLANFTGGTAGDGFNEDYTPEMGKAVSTVTSGFGEVTLNGIGDAVFPNGLLGQIVVLTPKPQYRKVTFIIKSLNPTTNNHVQTTLFRSADGNSYRFVSIIYVDSTHVNIAILAEGNTTLASSGSIAVTYPFTVTVTYITPGKIVATIGGNTVNATGVDITGLLTYCDLLSSNGAVISSFKLEYSPLVDTETFLANFTGSNGTTMSTYVPDKGTMGTPIVPGVITLNGSGQATTSSSDASEIVPAGAVAPNRKGTAIINSIGITASTFITLRKNGGLQNYAEFFRADATNYQLHIKDQTGVMIAGLNIVSPSFPVTFTAQIVGNTITTTAAGSTLSTTANTTGDFIDFITTVPGAVWDKLLVETL